MLSERMLGKLNDQIGLEFISANMYLQMSSWCASQGLDGCAEFLRMHSQEEMDHMRKLFDYVNETGAQAIVPALEKTPHEFESVLEVFRKTLEHEKHVTSKINELVDTALTEKDYSTFHFLQWYVAEQHEEEALFSKVVDTAERVGSDGRGVFLFDRELTRLRASHES